MARYQAATAHHGAPGRRDGRLSRREDSGDAGCSAPQNATQRPGTAELAEDPGKPLPTALSHKYLGEDPLPEPDEVTRLIVRVIPERINTFRV